MKLRILQEELAKAVNIASRFVSPRAQLPVLSNIYLEAKANKLLLSATNLETSISLKTGARVEKEGKITVPARTFSDIIGNLKTGSISLSEAKEQIKIESVKFSSNLSGMNASDFPSIPSTISKSFINFPKKALNSALSSVLFAVSSDETRPVLTGVLLILQGKKAHLVATDGFRLSQKSFLMKKAKKKQSIKIIIPKTALLELIRLEFKDDDVKLEISEKDNQAVFAADGVVLASRVIEGEFPDFEKIIPKESKYEIFVDKEELLTAVKLASVFARDSANVVKLVVKKDSIIVSAESSKSGSQESEVDAKVEGVSKKSDELEIAFNYRFLEELLGAVKGEELRLEFSNSNSPGVFTDPKDKNFLHLIMPVRLQV